MDSKFRNNYENYNYVTGYNVYRSLINPHIGFELINTQELQESAVQAFIDYDLSTGTGYAAYYKVKAINGSKSSDYSNRLDINYSGLLKSIEETSEENNTIFNYKLYQNYPNPFNPATVINFSLKNDGNTILNVYNLTGELVAELLNEFTEAGEYSINFTAENLPSGVYIYKLSTNNYTEAKKFILAK